MGHTCHAMLCEVNVPPRMHMCKRHWFMVPKRLRDALWASYRPGQERRMNPSADYLRAAAACVQSVAQKEGYPDDAIEDECEPYLSWAEMVDSDSGGPSEEKDDA